MSTPVNTSSNDRRVGLLGLAVLVWFAVMGWMPVAIAAPAAPANDGAEPSESPVATTSRITPDPSNIGDLLQYEVVAAYPRGVTVNLPSGLSFEPLHLVSVEESEPEVTGDGLRKTFTLQLQYFDVGEAQVPGFDLTYVDADGQVQTVGVPPKPFAVEALLANEADPQRKGEDPPISIEYPNERAEIIIYASLGALVLAAILVPIVLLLMRRQKPFVPPPPIPAHEVAYAALTELEQGELLAHERHADYYVQLTEIAKGYLQGRFGLHALDRTTDEIRADLVRHTDRVAPLSADEVIRFLQDCDLVKFARVRPSDEEAGEALSSVRTMVDRTVVAAARPKPDDEPPQDESSGEGEEDDQ